MSDRQKGVAARVFASDPLHYPFSGLNEIVPSRRTDIVIRQRGVFFAVSAGSFADVLPDHALIASPGPGSVVYAPILLRGAFIGTLNMLHEPGFYSPERLCDLDKLTPHALLTFERSLESSQKAA